MTEAKTAQTARLAATESGIAKRQRRATVSVEDWKEGFITKVLYRAAFDGDVAMP